MFNNLENMNGAVCIGTKGFVIRNNEEVLAIPVLEEATNALVQAFVDPMSVRLFGSYLKLSIPELFQVNPVATLSVFGIPSFAYQVGSRSVEGDLPGGSPSELLQEGNGIALFNGSFFHIKGVKNLLNAKIRAFAWDRAAFDVSVRVLYFK